MMNFLVVVVANVANVAIAQEQREHREVVLWHRFGKTGGTAVVNAMKAAGGVEILELYNYGTTVAEVAEVAREAIKKQTSQPLILAWSRGYQDRQELKLWGLENFREMTILRDPVDHCVSAVRYLLKDRNVSFRNLILVNDSGTHHITSLSDLIETGVLLNAPVPSVQGTFEFDLATELVSRFREDCSNLFSRKLPGSLEDFVVVGVTEDLGATVAVLDRTFPHFWAGRLVTAFLRTDVPLSEPPSVNAFLFNDGDNDDASTLMAMAPAQRRRALQNRRRTSDDDDDESLTDAAYTILARANTDDVRLYEAARNRLATDLVNLLYPTV